MKLSAEALQTFCRDFSTIYCIETTYEQQPARTETARRLKRYFSEVAAICTVKVDGILNNPIIQLIFGKEGLFTLGGVMIVLPRQRILENRKSGTAKKALEISDTIKQAGDMMATAWNKAYLKESPGPNYFAQKDVFVGNLSDRTTAETGLADNQELVFIPYKIKIASYPPFKCGFIFPPKNTVSEKTKLEEKIEIETAAKEKSEAEKKARIETIEKTRAEMQAKAEAEKRAKIEAKAKEIAEKKTRIEAIKKAMAEAELRIKAKAEEQARIYAENKARMEAEAKARAEAQAKAEAEAKIRAEAEEKAKAEAARRAEIEAIEKAKTEAKAKAEAERKARKEAKAREIAERKAKKETEKRVQRGAKERARVEAEARAMAIAEEKTRVKEWLMAKVKVKAETEAQKMVKENAKAEARKMAEAKAKAKAKVDAEAKARAEAKAKAKAKIEAERKAKSEMKAKAKTERRARIEAEKRARVEARERARLEAKLRVKTEAEEKTRFEAERIQTEAKAKVKFERRARIEAEKRANAEAREKARIEAELQTKTEAEEKAKIEAEAKAKAEAKMKAKAEATAKAMAKAEEKARKEAERKVRLEAIARAEAEKITRATARAQEKARRTAEKRTRIEARGKNRADVLTKAEAYIMSRYAETKAKLEADEETADETELQETTDVAISQRGKIEAVRESKAVSIRAIIPEYKNLKKYWPFRLYNRAKNTMAKSNRQSAGEDIEEMILSPGAARKASAVPADEDIFAAPPPVPDVEPTASLCAEDVMQRNIVWGRGDYSIQQGLDKMREHNTNYMLIGDNKLVEGIVSKSDLTGNISPYLRPEFARWRRPLDDATLHIKIKWVMSRPVQIIRLDTPLAVIMESMRRFGRRALPVADERGRIRGLITVFDVFKSLIGSGTETATAAQIPAETAAVV